MPKGMIASATSIISLRKVAAIEGGIGPRTLLGNDFAMGRLAGAAGFEPANAGTKIHHREFPASRKPQKSADFGTINDLLSGSIGKRNTYRNTRTELDRATNARSLLPTPDWHVAPRTKEPSRRRAPDRRTTLILGSAWRVFELGPSACHHAFYALRVAGMRIRFVALRWWRAVWAPQTITSISLVCTRRRPRPNCLPSSQRPF